MEETQPQTPPAETAPTAPSMPGATGLRGLPRRCTAWVADIRRAISFRLACSAATLRPPAWWVRLSERAAARRERLSWWWEGYCIRIIRPRAEAMRRRRREAQAWARDRWCALRHWCDLRLEPIRRWYADRAAAAARRSADLGDRLAEFKNAHVQPAVRAMESRLPQSLDARQVKQGLIVLRNEWEKTALAACLLIAVGIIWWNWRLPTLPPPTPAEVALVRSFTANAPKRFDFSKLVDLPKEPPAQPGR